MFLILIAESFTDIGLKLQCSSITESTMPTNFWWNISDTENHLVKSHINVTVFSEKIPRSFFRKLINNNLG